jgi:phage baseplate assembly protein W
MTTPLPATDPLGTDLHLDQDGDLLLTLSGSLDLLSGQANVGQAARVHLQTLPHTYLWGTSVGSKLAEYVEQPLTDRIKLQIQNLATDTLSRDPRILGIAGIELDDSEPHVLNVTIHAVVAAVGTVQLPFRIGR